VQNKIRVILRSLSVASEMSEHFVALFRSPRISSSVATNVGNVLRVDPWQAFIQDCAFSHGSSPIPISVVSLCSSCRDEGEARHNACNRLLHTSSSCCVELFVPCSVSAYRSTCGRGTATVRVSVRAGFLASPGRVDGQRKRVDVLCQLPVKGVKKRSAYAAAL
jgi:hypothetical protein